MVGGVCMVGVCAWEGLCVVGGVHGRGMYGWGMCGGGHTWQEVCMAEGVCAGGVAGACMVGACVARDAWWGRLGVACMAGETATSADGTHPTGMLSCWFSFSR